MNLNSFLSSTLRNAWIAEKHMKVYVRRSMRLINVGEEMSPCLDLATVEVSEKHRGKGILTAFLKRFEAEAKNQKRAVYIESILNPRLYDYLLENGYTRVPLSSDISPCVFKKHLDIRD